MRRCPDAASNNSGCVGGVGEGEGPCREWLQGPYCKLCNVTDTSRYYDAGESACLRESRARGNEKFGGAKTHGKTP